MNVIDEEKHFWFLFDTGDEMLLDVNCNHGPVGYSFTMVLNDDELAEYRRQGKPYIQLLANEIQNSAPGHSISTSRYKARHIFNRYQDEILQAIKSWRESN